MAKVDNRSSGPIDPNWIPIIKYDYVQYEGATQAQISYAGGDPREILTEGEIYEVEKFEVHDCHTLVYLEGVDGHFNSVCFTGVPDHYVEGFEEMEKSEASVQDVARELEEKEPGSARFGRGIDDIMVADRFGHKIGVDGLTQEGIEYLIEQLEELCEERTEEYPVSDVLRADEVDKILDHFDKLTEDGGDRERLNKLQDHDFALRMLLDLIMTYLTMNQDGEMADRDVVREVGNLVETYRQQTSRS